MYIRWWTCTSSNLSGCSVFTDADLIGLFVWALWQVLITSPYMSITVSSDEGGDMSSTIPVHFSVLQSWLPAVSFCCPLSLFLSRDRKCWLTSTWAFTKPSWCRVHAKKWLFRNLCYYFVWWTVNNIPVLRVAQLVIQSRVCLRVFFRMAVYTFVPICVCISAFFCVWRFGRESP